MAFLKLCLALGLTAYLSELLELGTWYLVRIDRKHTYTLCMKYYLHINNFWHDEDGKFWGIP
jgi:hypothetical protein